MAEVRITGYEKLERLGVSLQRAGRGDLRRALLDAFEKAGRPLVDDVREGARRTLPQSGGLAERVAGGKFLIRRRLTGASVGVRIEGDSDMDIEAMDRGVVYHPVYGGRTMVAQSIGPGWFTDPANRGVPPVRTAMIQVLDDLATQIERSAL